MLLNGISGSLEMLILILVGVLVGRSKLTGENFEVIKGFLPKLLTYIALPAYMVSNLTQEFSKGKLIGLIPEVWIPVVSMLILFFISCVLSYVFNVPLNHRGTFQSMFFNSNTIFVGLPINMALFGSESFPYVLVYYIANTALFWSLGAYLISNDSLTDRQKINLSEVPKKLFSPPMLGFMVGIILVLMNIHLPEVLSNDVSYLGNMTTPLAMLFIGLTMSKFKVKDSLTIWRFENIGVLFGRFIVAPMVTFLLMRFSSGSDLMKNVFFIQAAMPVMTNAPVVAQMYGGDTGYASSLVVESTFLSIIVVPILSCLIR